MCFDISAIVSIVYLNVLIIRWHGDQQWLNQLLKIGNFSPLRYAREKYNDDEQ